MRSPRERSPGYSDYSRDYCSPKRCDVANPGDILWLVHIGTQPRQMLPSAQRQHLVVRRHPTQNAGRAALAIWKHFGDALAGSVSFFV